MLSALAGTGCAEDSNPPSPTGDAGNATAVPPVLNKHRLTASGGVIVGPSGARIPIDPNKLTGYVDAVTPNAEHIDLNGWAALADLSVPADTVVAIAGKKSVAVTPSISRPDVADGYDRPGIEQSGFGLSVPLSSLDCSAPHQGLKTFAVSRGAATPLKWLADVPQRIADAC